MTSQTEDRGTGAWADEEWVSDLFDTVPEVIALSELQRASGGFHYDFVVHVKFHDGKARSYLLAWCGFQGPPIARLVRTALVRFENEDRIDSRWLDCIDRRTVRLTVRRSDLVDIPAAADNTCAVDALANRGRFHLRIIATRLGLMDTVEDRNTFNIMELRQAAEFIHVKEKEDREKRIEQGYERRQLAKKCTECQADFATNLRFGSGTADQLCGECAAKRDEAAGELKTGVTVAREVQLEPARRSNTKFDPRPGIDDTGGFSSPTWDE